MDRGDILWEPPPDAAASTRMGRYMTWLADERSVRVGDYQSLWQWSVDDLDGFWSSIWDYFEVQPLTPASSVRDGDAMPGVRWFRDATLNYAVHALRNIPDDAVAVISLSQSRQRVDLTGAGLRDQVGRARAGLQRLGVGEGDRVAAYLPNIAETVVAFLATASLGAVWSSCAPEFGTRSVVDRFQQIEPKVLLAVDGYRYGARDIDRSQEVEAIRDALPTLEATIVIPYRGSGLPEAIGWDELTAEPGPLEFAPVSFDHPLYVLYSSGTTGLPKAIVHGHGGILLEHLKAIALHGDLGPGDTFFWFSTTGWMMWNFLVSGLLVGATLVCFDGDPGSPDLMTLWRMAADVGVTFFGTSAPFILACRKAGVHPGADVDLSRLRGVGSTGAPLPPEGFRWVYDEVGRDLLLGSISGGTDVCTAFVGMAPVLPVRAGEIACRYLGAKVEAFDASGQPVIGEEGELVITAPMPSMPVGFWNDADGSKYRAAYFDDYPVGWRASGTTGVWRHGDWITITEDGACIITGRSDATLNRGGVRLGTAEFYSVVEGLDEIVDSLVIHLDDDRLLLFVVVADGAALDDALTTRIASELRSQLSPRHVPDQIVAVPAIPRTLSGKKLEVPVKRILSGVPPERAASEGALADPAALAAFAQFARGQSARSG
jgi:acetoacetyl-CoA synthetase